MGSNRFMNMKITKYIKVSALVLMLLCPVLALAVSKEEMEQARTIAAKSYLRYANDGSGYLDDLNPKTMEELESQIKTKEKENIKAFKAIPVPQDYATWDKEKLVEYWAVTAFQNKGLLEKGRGGRIRARSLINKMTIAPVKAEAKPTPEPAAKPDANAKKDSTKTQAGNDVNETLPQQIAKDEQAITADEELLQEDSALVKESNYTWVYIMVLCILVGLVLTLVVYAANVMKKSGRDDGGVVLSGQVDPETLEQLESAIADKDVEIAMLKKKIDSLTKQNSDLKASNENLKSKLENAKSAQSAYTVTTSGSATSSKNTENVSTSKKNSGVRAIYLGRANHRGIFVRADRNLNVGNSIFVLETSDGYSGSFRVADAPAAWSLGLSNPKEYLDNACTVSDPEELSRARKIITLTSGTAIFEGGCWRVSRKARIKYVAD